jgi:uncharacterized membrane protein YbhN (UPF0104 family)
MLNKKLKNIAAGILKIVVSFFAILFVLSKIDVAEIASAMKSASMFSLILAILFYSVSKIVSAQRTLLIVRSYKIPVSVSDNLKLYWKGMFYNLFLPGGIGGDAYKAVVLSKLNNGKLLHSASAMLLDRIAGAIALVCLALVFFPFTAISKGWIWISFTGIPFFIAGFYFLIVLINPDLKIVIPKLLGWSFIVQILQILTAMFILIAYGIEEKYASYILLFLVSSLAAMLPLSVGGVGIREVVFLTGSGILSTDQNYSVTISFTFYLISLIVALPGVLMKTRVLEGSQLVSPLKAK